MAACWAQNPGAGNQPANEKGDTLFSQNCAACHGSDGRGGERAPSIATRRDIVALSDAELRQRVEKGVLSAGMPAFGFLGQENIGALVDYLRRLQGRTATAAAPLPGDPAEGERLFFQKASCSRCHIVQGHGGFIADDLSDYGQGRSADVIRKAIVDPGAVAGDVGQAVQVMTVSGKTVTGVLRAEDNFTAVVQTEDGAFHSFSHDQIRNLEKSGHSLMPRNYATRLSGQEINDLVSYLMKTGNSAETAHDQSQDDKD